ncbi:hypothetical protein LR48_Vigan01g211000 [Vigna angularis]|uniref:Uncharacterized protein n=1 Tax=Phaseolus angularis TaxID=3914 RepID=A0A0L9TQW5_PHAAN|nr:hypothetical protein LR48_Vigan01g211000 [Vigna angularis]
MTETFYFALLTSSIATAATEDIEALVDDLEEVEEEDGVVGLPAGLVGPTGDFRERSSKMEARWEERTTLSANVAHLSFLSNLSLADNKFSSPIPSPLSSLSALRFLNLSSNGFNQTEYTASHTTMEPDSLHGTEYGGLVKKREPNTRACARSATKGNRILMSWNRIQLTLLVVVNGRTVITLRRQWKKPSTLDFEHRRCSSYLTTVSSNFNAQGISATTPSFACESTVSVVKAFINFSSSVTIPPNLFKVASDEKQLYPANPSPPFLDFFSSEHDCILKSSLAFALEQ